MRRDRFGATLRYSFTSGRIQMLSITLPRPTWTVRSLLLLPLILSPICWLLSTAVREHAEEQAALKRMAAVTHEVECASAGPAWLAAIGLNAGYLSRVKGISIWGTESDASVVEYLRAFRHLEWLSLRDPRWLSAAPTRSAPGPHYGFVKSAVVTAVRVPTLRRLEIVFTGIDEPLVRAISKVESLRELRLSGGSVMNHGAAALSDLAMLESLTLFRFRLSDGEAAAIARLRLLTALNISGSDVGDEGVRRLSTLPQLAELDLTDCTRVSDVGVDAIVHHACLESLSLAGCHISDRALAAIGTSEMRHCLRSLRLHDTRVTDRGVRFIQACERLQELSLRSTDITAYSLPILAGMPLRRQNVDLTDTYADADGTRCISAFFDGASPEQLRALVLATAAEREVVIDDEEGESG